MLKQVYIVSIIFLILHPGAVYGQSTVKLYGTVLDEQTGLPVDGANITVAGTGYGASTDPSGHFEIENLLEGVYTITATHIGYH
ncbi:carboxypeptidase-like regulatory domain-containing protein, partial [candidate division KSB1 bacterium]|nr:carboxypeptidase-like regulatory domain-containing protein [candidate division KSB1 bacterium]